MLRQEVTSLNTKGVQQALFPYLLAYEPEAMIKLCLTSKAFYFYFKDNDLYENYKLVCQLFHLLNKSSRLSATGSLNTLKEISEMVERKPFLMFETKKVKMVCDNQVHTISPIQFAYHTADEFLQDIFKFRAYEVGVECVIKFYQHAESAINETLENIDAQLHAYDELGSLAKAELSLEEQNAYFENMSEEEFESFRIQFDEFVRTKIGTAQATLPRWLIDVFFVGTPVALETYTALEENENGEDEEVNVETSLASTTHQLGKHFALFRDGENIRAQKSKFPLDTLIEQAEMLEVTFNERIESQKQKFIEEKETLNANRM